MQNDNVILPLDIYASCLKTINGIEFTPREVDIIACLLNGRSAKTMPSFLSISPKTVTTHINNIRRKAGCSSGEGIIDFIESSDKYSLIKHHYYSSLLNQLSFEKFLKASLREVSPPSLFCTLIDMQEKNDKPSLIHYLESHLKLMGIPVKYTNRAKKPPPSEEMKGSPDEYSLYIGATVPQTLILNENNTIFLITHKQLSKNCSQKCIDFSDPGNYYLSFIELLKILFPHHKFDQTSPDFMPYSRITSESSKKEYPPSSIVAKSVQAKLSLKTAKDWVSLFFKSRPLWLNLTGLIILGVGLTYIFSLVYMEDKTGKAFKNSPGSSRNFVRSDLFLPTETAFLNRKLLLSKLEKKLESNQGIQMAVLVGIGGSGKTTLARHYAQNQPASVVWEINAETKEKLMVSFEELAYALSKSQEEKKNLKEIQDIKNPAEKEKCLLIFLKERLKSHPNWLLIYDNLEAIADIKNFLPYDSDAWGNGKIILTTRNETLQNTSYIQAENMIPLGELSPEDAFKLFTKILYGSQPLTVIQKEQSLSLLKNIPLFPLDISMAAYYIKNSQLTPDQYLERISHNSQKFDVFQEALLKEVSDYTKTRSGIIISALEKLIHQSPDFQDLLLFISLLDFQH
ncbi:MAG TPA: hypothetical protein DEP85_02425, partial [Holosporales bacterium]|nr:hypothetical protein [Holosporales bacterium]